MPDRPSPARLLALLLLGAVACDLGAWIRASGGRSIRELSPEEAKQLLERPETLLVWLGPPRSRPERERSVALADPLAELDARISGAAGPVVVLGEDERANLRLAARLARDGIEEVAVVRGGVAAWRSIEARAEARRPAGG